MGSSSSVSWTPESDSLSDSAKKCILSDPIETDGLNPEKFMHAFERTIRTRPPLGQEISYETKDLPDGGVLAVAKHDGGDVGKYTVYQTFYFKKVTDEVLCHNFITDEKMAETSRVSTSHLQLHRDPIFQLEFWVDELANRRFGPLVMYLLMQLLSLMGSSAKCEMGADSLDGGGKCCISEPITDCAVTAESFLDWSRQSSIDRGFAEETDGSLKEENSSWLSSSSFTKHVYDKEKKEIRACYYGTDDSCAESSLEMTFTTKVHETPFRLEMYCIYVARRKASENEVSQISYITNEVVKSILEAEG